MGEWYMEIMEYQTESNLHYRESKNPKNDRLNQDI